MPSDPPTTSDQARAEWHARLAEKDVAAHERMATVATTTEAEVLRERLHGLSAELTVLRAAVAHRSRILHDQTLALAERDARIARLEAARARGGLPPVARALARRARAIAGRGARVVLRRR